jgi:hypothetical protein
MFVLPSWRFGHQMRHINQSFVIDIYPLTLFSLTKTIFYFWLQSISLLPINRLLQASVFRNPWDFPKNWKKHILHTNSTSRFIYEDLLCESWSGLGIISQFYQRIRKTSPLTTYCELGRCEIASFSRKVEKDGILSKYWSREQSDKSNDYCSIFDLGKIKLTIYKNQYIPNEDP